MDYSGNLLVRAEPNTPATPALSDNADENPLGPTSWNHRDRLPFSPLSNSYRSPRPPAYPSPAYPPWVSTTPPSYPLARIGGTITGKECATGEVDLQGGGGAPVGSLLGPGVCAGATEGASSAGVCRRQVEDLLLWAQPSKSALAFGTGLLLLTMAATMDPPPISCITGVAYAALVYLAGSFAQRLVRRHATPQPPREWMSAADADRVARMLMVLANAMAAAHASLFCGGTAITLKVAMALWVASLLGSVLSVFTLLCLCFVAAFTVPLIYVHNVDSIHRKVVPLLARAHYQWAQLPHGKPLTALGCVAVWSFFGVVTKLFLGLLLWYTRGFFFLADCSVGQLLYPIY
eukprot:jgi/Mesvir1/6075/Mv00802-RA.2